MPRPKGLPKTGGREELAIDMEELEKLAAIGCTQTEAANWFGLSLATLERRLADPEARTIWDRGQARAKVSLRRQQMASAAAGNPTMLIWLGKQFLGQKDKIEQSTAADAPTQTLEQFLQTSKELLEYEKPDRKK